MVAIYLREKGPYKLEKYMNYLWVDKRLIKPDATVATRWVASGTNTITHHLSVTILSHWVIFQGSRKNWDAYNKLFFSSFLP